MQKESILIVNEHFDLSVTNNLALAQEMSASGYIKITTKTYLNYYFLFIYIVFYRYCSASQTYPMALEKSSSNRS